MKHTKTIIMKRNSSDDGQMRLSDINMEIKRKGFDLRNVFIEESESRLGEPYIIFYTEESN